jgi:hypothetical protein
MAGKGIGNGRMFGGKDAKFRVLFVASAFAALIIVYVVFSHLSGPKAGESCGPTQHWVYVGEAKNFSCVRDR